MALTGRKQAPNGRTGFEDSRDQEARADSSVDCGGYVGSYPRNHAFEFLGQFVAVRDRVRRRHRQSVSVENLVHTTPRQTCESGVLQAPLWKYTCCNALNPDPAYVGVRRRRRRRFERSILRPSTKGATTGSGGLCRVASFVGAPYSTASVTKLPSSSTRSR